MVFCRYSHVSTKYRFSFLYIDFPAVVYEFGILLRRNRCQVTILNYTAALSLGLLVAFLLPSCFFMSIVALSGY